MRNLFHLVSRLWRLREHGWLTESRPEHLRETEMRSWERTIIQERQKEDSQEERRGEMMRVNWLKGGMTMVLSGIEVLGRSIIAVTRRNGMSRFMKSETLWRPIKVSRGRKEVIKGMGRRGVITINGQRGVVIKVIGLVMRDTSRTGMAVRNHGEITMT